MSEITPSSEPGKISPGSVPCIRFREFGGDGGSKVFDTAKGQVGKIYEFYIYAIPEIFSRKNLKSPEII
jgi:hypothetical protein